MSSTVSDSCYLNAKSSYGKFKLPCVAVSKRLKSSKCKLRQKEFQLRQKQQESDELAERILANRNVPCSATTAAARNQRTALDEQLALLESRERTIDRQRLYLWAIGFAFSNRLSHGRHNRCHVPE